MIHSDRLPLLVPALLRDSNLSARVFTLSFSGNGPVETAPLTVQLHGMTVAILTPLPEWVRHIGPQPVDLDLRTNDPEILCALEMFFTDRLAALEAEQVDA